MSRRFKFSLRTGFLFVTLLCAALSLWVVPAERKRRAAVAIEALGGRLEYASDQAADDSFPAAYLRRWLPQAYFDEVELLHLNNTRITDAGLAHLEGLTGLQWLLLDNTRITDAGLVHLEGLTGLRFLRLNNTQITDAGLAHLHRLTSLQWLLLDNTQITNAGLSRLRKALPNCRIDGP